MSIVVFVHVHTAKEQQELALEDRHLAGVYAVTLDSDVPEDGHHMAALDGFHDQVAIKVLDDFTITVRGRDGEIIPNEGLYANDELLEYVHSVEKTAEEPLGPEEALA